jgi:hypothetical protein
MKPLPGLDISKRNVSTPRGGAVEPLSRLAPDSPVEDPDRYALTDEDKALLNKVLTADDEALSDEALAADDDEPEPAGA